MYTGLVFLGFLLALVAATDYVSMRPIRVFSVSAISAVCAAIMWINGRFFETLYWRAPELSRSVLYAAAILNSLTWGLFFAATLHSFGYYDWKSLLLLVCMAGTAPLTLTSFAPSLALTRTYLICFSAPTIIFNVYDGGPRGNTLAAIFAWYFLFLFLFAKRVTKEYRQGVQREGALAAAESANRSKSDFLANIGHEIRTPMTGILGMTHMALNTELTGQQREYLDAVSDSGVSLLHLVDELLDYSKGEAGRLELNPVDFELAPFLDRVLKPFAIEAAARGLQFSCTIDPSVPVSLKGDAARLRQILVNVMGNALKFTGQGEVRVFVNLLDEDAGQDILQFSVSDTGIGIPLDQHTAIFKRFEQGSPDTALRYGGAGLGLAICSRIAGLMGGRIWVESEPGKGSKFHWTARFAPAHVRRPMVALKILVAEDSEINRRLVRELLELRGHIVTVASNGVEALALLEESTFDLILMDVQMPELDGLEATARVRQKEAARGQRIPIIALTANVHRNAEAQYLHAGMSAYLPKPIDPARLYELVEACAVLR